MKILLYVSDLIVPLVIFGIVSYGLLMKVEVYETFITGAKSGFFTVIKLIPTLVGLMVAVGILRASGFLDFLARIAGGLTEPLGFPAELVPLSVVKNVFRPRQLPAFCWISIRNMGRILILGKWRPSV